MADTNKLIKCRRFVRLAKAILGLVLLVLEVLKKLLELFL